MTEAKPCLPGCMTTRGRGGDIKSHAPACPNSAPKASEAPVACGACMEWDPSCEDCLRASPPPEEPAPAPEPKLEPCSVCGLIPDNKRHCCPPVHNPYAPAPEPKQGSEEPIDWEAVDKWAASTHPGIDRGMWDIARAYLALRAEVERLKKLHSDHCSNPICEGPRS